MRIHFFSAQVFFVCTSKWSLRPVLRAVIFVFSIRLVRFVARRVAFINAINRRLVLYRARRPRWSSG